MLYSRKSGPWDDVEEILQRLKVGVTPRRHQRKDEGSWIAFFAKVLVSATHKKHLCQAIYMAFHYIIRTLGMEENHTERIARGAVVVVPSTTTVPITAALGWRIRDRLPFTARILSSVRKETEKRGPLQSRRDIRLRYLLETFEEVCSFMRYLTDDIVLVSSASPPQKKTLCFTKKKTAICAKWLLVRQHVWICFPHAFIHICFPHA